MIQKLKTHNANLTRITSTCKFKYYNDCFSQSKTKSCKSMAWSTKVYLYKYKIVKENKQIASQK